MLRISGVAYHIGGRDLFHNLSFVVNDGESLGIVGPNGCGKTTLLRIFAGELPPSAGSVEVTGAGRTAHLVQGVDASSATAAEAFPRFFDNPDAGERLAEIAAEIAGGQDDAHALADEYDRLLQELESRAPAAGPEPDVEPSRRLDTLSGGQLERLAILDALADAPAVLLLDEPTNHLDESTVAWLEDAVRSFSRPTVIVSHDRGFLDAVATHILTLDPAAGEPVVTSGGYTASLEALDARRQRQLEAFHRQQKQERALKQEISSIESRARGIENSTIHFHYRKRAAKVARQAVTLRSRLERELHGTAHVEKPPPPARGIQASFASAPPSASSLAIAEGLAIDMEGSRLLAGVTFQVERGERVALVGPNGSGKSTLLRALLGEVSPAAGSARLAGSAVPGYLAQDDAMDAFGDAGGLTPVDWLRREVAMPASEAGNELHRYLGAHGTLVTPIARLSYGERRRLSLARLIIGGANVLLLDEPTNHLDIPAREAFEAALDGFDGAVIAASHDRYFVERWASRVLRVEDGAVTER